MPPHLKPKTRIASIQVCRGLAALAVVMAHLHNVEMKYFDSNSLHAFQYGVGGVDLFFVISGVVISAVTAGRFGDVRNATRFLYQRFVRIYPIYWIYTAIVLGAYLFNPLWINASGGHHVDILQSFLLIPTGVPMLLLQGWTLTYEIYFYLVFFLLLLFCPERYLLWIMLFWGSSALAVHFLLHPGQPILAMLFSPLIFEFLLGCLLFSIYKRASLHPAAGVVLIGLSLLVLLGIATLTVHGHHSNQEWIEFSPQNRLLAYGVFSFLFLLGIMELERSRIILFAAPLIALGDWSYSIYLSHTIVLKIVSHLFDRYFPRLTYSMGWVTGISLPAVLVAGYLSFNFIERPLMALLYKPSPRPVTALPHARGADQKVSASG